MLTGRKSGRAPRRGTVRRRLPARGLRIRDFGIVAAALLTAALMAGHRLVPESVVLGTLLDSFLPWLGVLVAPLALGVLLARSRAGLVALAVPVLVWSVMFAPAFLPATGGPGPAQFTVVTQNLDAANPRPRAAAADLLGDDTDLVAVQELDNTAVTSMLDGTFTHHVTVGTVGLWSRYPLTSTSPVDIGLGWDRALHTTVHLPWGRLRVYVVHLASIRPGVDRLRDRGIRRLASLVRADPAAHLMLLGDLNTASTDRQMDRLVPPLRDAQRVAGRGLGFTWPAAFPLTRPDQVLFRGLTATAAGVTPTAGSDHRGATAGFRMPS